MILCRMSCRYYSWYDTLDKLVQTMDTSSDGHKRDSSESDSTSLDSLQLTSQKANDSSLDDSNSRNSVSSQSEVTIVPDTKTGNTPGVIQNS